MYQDTRQDYEFAVKDIALHDRNAEMHLAAFLLVGKRSEIVTLATTLTEEDFFFPGYQALLRVVKKELDAGDTTDGVEHGLKIRHKYKETLEQHNWLDEGISQIVSDLTACTLDGKPEYYMPLVKQKTELRKILHELYMAVDMCRHSQDDNKAVYDYLQRIAFDRLATDSKDSNDLTKAEFGELMIQEMYDNLDKEKRKEKTINLPWVKFQQNTGGLNVQGLIIISAPSGQGKSAFALNIAANVGVVQRQPTLYINSEIPNNDMADRVDSHLAYVDSMKLRLGQYVDEKGELLQIVNDRVLLAAERYNKGELLFRQIPDLQIGNVEAMIQQDKAQRDTKLVIVDYIGRMDFEKNSNRDLQEWQVLRLSAMRLKRIAMEQNVCVVMVAQLTDQGTLQGSRAMKNEADLWINLEREQEEDKLAEMWPYNCYVNIKKARNCPDDTRIRFRYDGALMRFSDTPEQILDAMTKSREIKGFENDLMAGDEYDRLVKFVNGKTWGSNVPY